MAIRAGARWHRVQTSEWESSAVVVECRVQPAAGVVAGFASLRESAAHVVRICRALEILQVARHARRAGQVEVIVDVTIDALPRRHGVRARQNEASRGVVELAIGPGDRVMTLRARCREPGMRHRRGGIVVIGLMATHAGGRSDVEVVVDVTVRTLARRNRVRTGQSEAGGRVIELRVRPLHRVMALLARSREPRVRHRAYRGIEVVLVAADAGRAGDVEIVVHVAIRALPRGNRVRARQREARFRVIESRRLPGCGGVAGFASLREPATHVIRVGGSLKILYVTGHAGRAGQVVVVIDVAIGTLPRRDRMRARQHKVHRGMIETGGLPRRSGVALQAIRREIRSHVVRIPGALKILQVAG